MGINQPTFPCFIVLRLLVPTSCRVELLDLLLVGLDEEVLQFQVSVGLVSVAPEMLNQFFIFIFY